jgi:hypothetical protein
MAFKAEIPSHISASGMRDSRFALKIESITERGAFLITLTDPRGDLNSTSNFRIQAPSPETCLQVIEHLTRSHDAEQIVKALAKPWNTTAEGIIKIDLDLAQRTS